MLKKAIFIITLLIFNNPAYSMEYGGVVQGFYINESNLVLVKLKNDNTSPQCAVGTWQFKFNGNSDVAKNWISMLLASRMSNKKIIVGYTKNEEGLCSVHYFYYYN